MDIRIVVGERIKSLRESKNVLQKDLASKIGITKQSLSIFEKGTSSPRLDTLIKIADHFNVSVDYLLGRTDNQEINK